ncbi:hypothetical protein KGM_214411 [Danaus plexippus plexippus]|uniref:Uncharacterized protein n=1 Tax=Danaus plexippus plexippus TaxID=278856 RepID=A0A212FD06_DANPL|nr:hypothetical protein KGM_214411 [Danaus plexippus plexippus]
MPRWTYDVVFYRMFCVTMISTAIIFTLILTNIFIDIDGLLTNKKKVFPLVSDVSNAISKVENYFPPEDAQSNVFYDENSNYDGDFSPAQRTKRSTAETENILLQVRNPLMKKLITSKLAKLLEEMDKEGPKQREDSHQDVTTAKAEVTITEVSPLQKTVVREDLVHLAMHNILLQGLVGHMDLNHVFKKVHLLFRNINENTAIDEGKVFESLVESKETTEAAINAGTSSTYEEHKLIDEILNCKNLQDVVSEHNECKHTNKSATSHRRTDKEENVIIKTIIEINDSNTKKSSRPQNIQGLIKLIYNGKAIKIKQLNEKLPDTKETKYNRDIKETTVSSVTNSPEVTAQASTTIKNMYKQDQNPLNIVIEEYLKKHPFPNFFEDGSEIKAFESKRLKRQIKIRYFNDDKTMKPKQMHNKTKAKDDDLYIEIETHFDGKGVKGEKKKKLVKNLIEKIQKALNSDIQKPHDKERIKFIKRIQDPIDFKEHSIVVNKVVTSYEPVAERLLDPIGKTLKTHENVINRFGETWKKKVSGPSFLTVSKSVNSAEMRELNINYDAVSRNGIPKRLQQPLNAEVKDDDITMKAESNTGNMSLFFKDIDGTGFSIGINQYVGEPPDKDSMRIFNGIESLIREYHKSYDHGDVSNESNIEREDNYVQRRHKISKRDADYVEDDLNEYTKAMDTDYHSNTYKMFMEGNVISEIKNDNYKNVPIVINGKLLNKELKPSEILTLANLAKRKKRALNVKKISNLKSKIKLNRYINTKAMANKKIFLKNKRNKREIQKIRIIARDHSEIPKQSDEKIFLISRENTYSDKVIRDIEDPETVIDKKTHDLNDDTFPFGDFFRMQNPEAQPIFSDNEYETKVRPNVVLSKYPHIFMDDMTNSKSEDSKDTYVNERTTKSKQYRIKYGPKQIRANNRVEATTVAAGIFAPDQKVNDFVNALLPPISRAKYKVSVKVTPKNISTNSGFKEVHTSVNKSFDQDGVRYYSLLNVSEISKVEKLNRSDRKFDLRNNLGIDIAQQRQMKTLLRLHKKRVDQQLSNLIRESKHLEAMMKEDSEINMNGTINILKGDDEDKDGLKEEKINKILDSVKKLEETYKTTSPHATTEPATDSPVENDKAKLIDTIKLNEQVTCEILKKIDTNTNILKTFLQKFNDKIDTEKHSAERNYGGVKLDMTKDWKLYNAKDPFFAGDELKNDTVPFIYAYQQQMPIVGKDQSLASLMYHGHIHANSVQDINHNKFKKANIKDTNNTAYFVNAMDDFNTKPGPFVSANININTTNA